MLKSIDTINLKLDRLEADPPIDLGDIDFNIKKPMLLQQHLGRTMLYFDRVEKDVNNDATKIKALLPHLDEPTNRFIKIWTDQETRHGLIFDELLKRMNLRPAEVDGVVPRMFQAGALLNNIPGMTNVLDYIYRTRGAMHEKLTSQGYKALAKKMTELGELGLVKTMIKPIQRQEAAHLGYYRQSAAEMKESLSPWQLYAARIITKKTYRPVGVHNPDQAISFGHLVRSLVSPEDREAFTTPVQDLANKLFHPEIVEETKTIFSNLRRRQNSEYPRYVIDAVLGLANDL